MSALPEPTRDLARARRDLDEYGLALVDALSPDETRRVRERTFEAADEDVRAGRGYVYDRGEANQRVWALLNRGAVYCDLVQRDFAIELVGERLGRPLLLSNFSANLTGPGGGTGFLHTDQFYADDRDELLAMNVAWLVTDFTRENGATLVVPGSHRRRLEQVGLTDPHPEAVPLEAPAGTAAVLDGRLWHQTGPNATTDERRVALFAYYVKPWIRTQEVWPVSLDPEVRKSATPLLRELVGDVQYMSLGAVGGQPLDGPRF